MNSFKSDYLRKIQIPLSMTWLVGRCMELRGKQDLWLKTKPDVLETLKELAIIQSTESSNRIEGVTISKERLKPLIFHRAKPRDRPEEEILGYKKALDWIHKSFNKIEIQPQTILKLHSLAQGGSSWDAGAWKEKNNEIIEILPNGERKIRFIPISAKDTPKAIGQLCLAYQHVLQKRLLPELLAVAAFIFDFLCIHPFRDGNGRVSRLLTCFLLYQQGFFVGKYISLERLVENSKEDYYQSLHQSSSRWHTSHHTLEPWFHHFLSILNEAYRELTERVETQSTSQPKGEIISQIILDQSGLFTLANIRHLCPHVSEQMIKNVLSRLKNDRKVTLAGKGRGAKWKVLS